MRKDIFINGNYINIPICPGKEEKMLRIFLRDKKNTKEEKKVFELMIPVDDSQEKSYVGNFYAQIPMHEFAGRTLQIVSDVPESFVEAIYVGSRYLGADIKQEKPVIHFAADTGWTNDPNGLIYDNGTYHLYFQYNPFNTEWNNMSWGHAVSTDLLHWKQVDSVMFPDKDGTIFSGCAIKNEQGLLGLPKDALLFYYTAAGGNDDWSRDQQFIQKIAYSLDGGKTLTKMEEPCVPVIYRDSRDPKVYWHEESKAYVMVLWLKGNDFGILRSVDLKNWKLMEEFTLQDAWECPDIFALTSEEGEMCWFFWSADGYYYVGEFDGSHFKTDGIKHCAYLTDIPYAAQTYSGVSERIISIPWLRLKNDGRAYTGAYGIPVELACKKTNDGFIMIQKPVRELMEQAVNITEYLRPDNNGIVSYQQGEKKKALAIRIQMGKEASTTLRWQINGSWIDYIPEAGRFVVDREGYHTKQGYRELLFIVDDKILEVFFEDGVQVGTFALRNAEISVKMLIQDVQDYEIYEID